jgi:hypothetical protein
MLQISGGELKKRRETLKALCRGQSGESRECRTHSSGQIN